MKLIPALDWINNFDKWKAKRMAESPRTDAERIVEKPSEYLRLVQTNAMEWCMGKTQKQIEKKVRSLQ